MSTGCCCCAQGQKSLQDQCCILLFSLDRYLYYLVFPTWSGIRWYRPRQTTTLKTYGSSALGFFLSFSQCPSSVFIERVTSKVAGICIIRIPLNIWVVLIGLNGFNQLVNKEDMKLGRWWIRGGDVTKGPGWDRRGRIKGWLGDTLYMCIKFSKNE